jgi:RimJ/RimL family protein N-acetyltransferase
MALLLFEGAMRTVMTIEDLVVTRFTEGTLPRSDWTHRAHLTVGTWYVHQYGPEDALRRLREGILQLNQVHGTANTETGGYHETITRAYVSLITDFLTTCRQGASAAECTERLLSSPLADKDALLTYYSRKRLASVEARRGWVSPDVRTLSARILCCPTILDGGIAFLRRFRVTDTPVLVELLMNPALMKWAIDDRPFSWPEAEAFIRRHFQQADAFGFGTVCEAGSNMPIGFGGFRQCRLLAADDLEFGVVLAPEYHGKGYATALGRKLIEHALTVLRLPRVLAACHPDNAASEHVLRDKLGMQFHRDVRIGPHRRRVVYGMVRRPR